MSDMTNQTATASLPVNAQVSPPVVAPVMPSPVAEKPFDQRLGELMTGFLGHAVGDTMMNLICDQIAKMGGVLSTMVSKVEGGVHAIVTRAEGVYEAKMHGGKVTAAKKVAPSV